jgi:hypothetical protein
MSYFYFTLYFSMKSTIIVADRDCAQIIASYRRLGITQQIFDSSVEEQEP